MLEKKQSWYDSAVIYQIYTLSYKDTNGDGYGDLNGIIEKLDYIKDLGVDAIWLTPFYKSPLKDFGYDVSNHNEVDPIFGYLFDFDRLISEAHSRNIKVLIDLVLNHTSSEHNWFLESKKSKDNPKRDWYIWREGKIDKDGREIPPNNWVSVFGGPSWTKDALTNEWYLHTFLSSQPDLNWRNPEVKNEIFKTMDFWLTRGVDGFRGDAVHHFFEDEEFGDEEENTYFRPGIDDPYNAVAHNKTNGLPETIESVLNISNHIQKYGDIVFISEAYLDIDGLLHVYKNCPVGNHMPFNFNFLSLPWEANSFKNFVDRYIFETGDFPKNYVLGNHDRHRIITRLGKEKSLSLTLLSFVLPGATFIYYGDEIGMEDIEVINNKELDPWGKQVPGMSLGRDGERGVMQWDNNEYAGFSSIKPWIGLPKNQNEINVNFELKDEDSVLNFYKSLISLSKKDLFKYGSYVEMPIQNENIFCFYRKHNDKKAYVYVNMSENERSFDFPLNGKINISSRINSGAEKGILAPNEAVVVEL